MPLELVVKVRLIAPRSELLHITRELVSLHFFHPEEKLTPQPDRNVEELLSSVRQIYVEAQEVASDLGFQDDVPITEQLLKGYHVERTVISAKTWEELAKIIINKAEPLLNSYRMLKGELANVEKEIKERTSILLSLKGLETLDYNLEALERMKWVKIFLFTLQTRSLSELKRALPDILIYQMTVGTESSLVLAAGFPGDSDRVLRTIRVLDAKPIAIPKGIPSNPSEAHKQLDAALQQLQEMAVRVKREIEAFADKNRQQILTLKEASRLVLSNLEKLRKPSGFERVVVIEGYIPQSRLSEFEKKMSRWIVHVEGSSNNKASQEGHETSESRYPTILRNNRYFKAYEKITLTQGPPTRHEMDPTPFIGIVFPLFYGMMFGDVGHGLILLLFGLFMLKRTETRLKPWALMLTTFGVSAAVSGLMVGEYFGLHGHEVPILGDLLEPLHKLGRTIGLTVESEEIPRLLGLAVLIGSLHLSLGFALDVMKKVRSAARYEAITLSLPTFIWYVLGAIPFGIGLVQVNIDLQAVGSSQAPHLLFPSLTVADVTNYIVLPVTVICGLSIVLSHPLGILLNIHRGPLGDAIIMGPIEWLLRLIEFLANTISYVRIGILLIIHATLVSVVRSFTYDSIFLIPAAIVFNVLVIAMEGMIVFIQALRLHLYEWFTKFYEGTGRLFEGLGLDGYRVKIQLTGLE